MKELRADMNTHADDFRKESENIKSQEKLENSSAEMQTELKPLQSRRSEETICQKLHTAE